MGIRRCCCDLDEAPDVYCRWPCCVMGLRFWIRAKAIDLDDSTDGLFICTEMKVRVFHNRGGQDECISHHHFEKVDDKTTYVELYWGGGDDHYTFGIPVETEDLLCEHTTADCNVEVTLVFVNVTHDTVTDGSGMYVRTNHQARLTLSDPILNGYWGSPQDAVTPDKQAVPLTCLYAESISGAWSNLANACTPSTDHTVVADPGDVVSVKYKFGPADPDKVCHWCATPASGEEVHKTEICDPGSEPSGIVSGDIIQAKYLDSGESCYKRLPCEVDDDAPKRIGAYTVEDDCLDADCPVPDCECISDTCECGCTSPAPDLVVGGPSYLDLACLAAVGLNPENLEFQVCMATVSGSGGGPACAAFAHSESTYGYISLSEIPWEIIWDAANTSWKAFIRGTATAVPGHATVEVFGPASPGISTCSWHGVHLNWTGTQWRLGVNVGGGFTYGTSVTPPAGFSRYSGVPYWGAHNREQLGGVHGLRIPAGSLQT